MASTARTIGTTGHKTAPGVELSITRYLDAPREEAFRMMVDPLLIPRWWGPRGRRTVVDRMDVHPGGEWRFEQHDDEGNEYGFHGMYLEVDFPNRLVHTMEYEGTAGQERSETAVFVTVDGKTVLTLTEFFESRRARDAALAAGLLEDFAASMDHFAELLGERPYEVPGLEE